MTRTRNTTLALALSAAAASLAFFAAPAHAVTGQEAIAMCEARPRSCAHATHADGSIDIVVGNSDGIRTVQCDGLQGECRVISRRAPRRDLRDNANVAGNAGVNRGAQAPVRASPMAPYLLNDTDAQLHRDGVDQQTGEARRGASAVRDFLVNLGVARGTVVTRR